MRSNRLAQVSVQAVRLILVTATAGCQQEVPNSVSGDYYVYEGKKISLQRSQSYSAMQLKENYSAQKTRLLEDEISQMGFGTIVESPLCRKHGLLLIRIKKDILTKEFKAGVRHLTQHDGVERENPVYDVGGIEQVLVNEFIVQFKEGVSGQEINDSIRKRNGKIVERNETIKNRYVLTFPNKSPREALSIINEYNKDPLVQFSEPNFIRLYPQAPTRKDEVRRFENVQPFRNAAPNDSFFARQWYLENNGLNGKSDADIDAPEAWRISHGSSAVILAIIDCGVQTNHPDLRKKIVTPYDATDDNDDQEPMPWDFHGTACAGIAAASTNNGRGIAGVGWDVKIMPIRVLYSAKEEDGPTSDAEWMSAGIRMAVDRGAHVLSNSWVGGGPSAVISSAIEYAISKNRVVVFAAGNCSGEVSYPAYLSLDKEIIAVSATNEWDEFKTKISKDGEKWWGSNCGPEITVSAPGVHMFTTDITGSGGRNKSEDYLDDFNGTSAATPLVAGTVALILSRYPNLRPLEVRSLLQETCDDLGAIGYNKQFKYKKINTFKTLSQPHIYSRR